MFKHHLKVIVSLLLVAMTIAAFCQVISSDFVNYDDGQYVTENRYIFAGITSEGIIWSFTTFHAANWHPLTWLSHMLDGHLYRLNPTGHHVTNLIFHIANTLLLFLLFTRVTKALWPSAMVAALFALHPLRVESVAWVAERKDVLSTFFWMTTMWAYVWYVEGPNLKRYLLVLLSYALGLMAKPMLVTLPLVLLLLDYWPLERFRPAPKSGKSHAEANLTRGAPQTLAYLVAEKVPLLALAVFSSIITILAQKQALMSLERIPFELRLANSVFSYVGYLGKMLWPAHLAVFYPYPGPELSWWGVAAAGLVLVGCSTLALTEARQRPYLAVGWFWYLGTLVPVIGLVQVGEQAMADRYTYIPLIGLFLMLVWAARDLTDRWRRQKVFLAVLAGIILTSCVALTWRQAGYWRNSISLFQHAIEVTYNNWIAYTTLGAAYTKQGETDKAIPLFKQAIAINPNYAQPYNNLGWVYFIKGTFNEAIPLFKQAIAINPNYAQPYNNLGWVYANQNKIDEATLLFKQAIAINPNYAEPYNNLGWIYANQNKFDEAIPLFKQAITLKHNYAEPYQRLGLVYVDQGKFDKAIHSFRQAITINPNMAEAYSNLGLIYAKQGEFDEALPFFQEAIRIKPDLIEAYNNLGLLYAKQGKTDEAISILQKSITINANNTIAQEMLNQLNKVKNGSN